MQHAETPIVRCQHASGCYALPLDDSCEPASERGSRKALLPSLWSSDAHYVSAAWHSRDGNGDLLCVHVATSAQSRAPRLIVFSNRCLIKPGTGLRFFR